MTTSGSKNDRREAAREQARLEREKAKRRQRVLRWLIPSGVSTVVLAIVVIVALVVANSGPAPQTSAGPKNMISDGIVFTGQSGKVTPTLTPAIPASGSPTASATDATDGVAHITTYIDLQCPYCQAFEETNLAAIEKLVAAGTATLEVHPISILDRSSQGTRYASRAANTMGCVANFAPDDFLSVLAALYEKQPTEGSSGLTDSEILSIVHDAGLRDSPVDKCVNGETFKDWVSAATSRAAADSSLFLPGQSGISTPTVVVNGHLYAGAVDDAAAFSGFVSASR